jgi:hypothetical protein
MPQGVEQGARHEPIYETLSAYCWATRASRRLTGRLSFDPSTLSVQLPGPDEFVDRAPLVVRGIELD